jgi:hypothetical protein
LTSKHILASLSGAASFERKGLSTDKRNERVVGQEKEGRIQKKVSNDTATTVRGRVLDDDSDDDIFDTKPGN